MSQYVVSFARIGRTNDVPDLTVSAENADELSDAILRYARPHLYSRDIAAVLEGDQRSGWIFAGFRTASTFTISPIGGAR